MANETEVAEAAAPAAIETRGRSGYSMKMGRTAVVGVPQGASAKEIIAAAEAGAEDAAPETVESAEAVEANAELVDSLEEGVEEAVEQIEAAEAGVETEETSPGNPSTDEVDDAPAPASTNAAPAAAAPAVDAETRAQRDFYAQFIMNNPVAKREFAKAMQARGEKLIPELEAALVEIAPPAPKMTREEYNAKALAFAKAGDMAGLEDLRNEYRPDVGQLAEKIEKQERERIEERARQADAVQKKADYDHYMTQREELCTKLPQYCEKGPNNTIVYKNKALQNRMVELATQAGQRDINFFTVARFALEDLGLVANPKPGTKKPTRPAVERSAGAAAGPSTSSGQAKAKKGVYRMAMRRIG